MMTETTVKPIHRVGGSSTPSAAPSTQHSCMTDSDRPKAEARDSSGRSSWIEESRQTLPIALVPAATSAASAATTIEPNTAASTHTTRLATVDATTIRCGFLSSSRVPAALPTKLPIPAAAPTDPISASCTQPEWLPWFDFA